MGVSVVGESTYVRRTTSVMGEDKVGVLSDSCHPKSDTTLLRSTHATDNSVIGP